MVVLYAWFLPALVEKFLVLMAMGDYQDALPMSQQALTLVRASLGEDSAPFAICLNNLGLIQQALGAYEDALISYQQSIDIRRRVYGEQHPAYAKAINNIEAAAEMIGNI